MEGILIVNGSPRAPRSNSKLYAEAFMKGWRKGAEYMNLTLINHQAIIEKIGSGAYREVLFVFPLYADGIPSTLLSLWKDIEAAGFVPAGTRMSLIVNCGFYERTQNEVAIKMARLFAKRAGFDFASSFSIASEEATPGTIFRHLLYWRLRRFGRGLRKGRKLTFSYTMPISKRSFLRASTKFWLAYGARNGIDGKAMSTRDIEK